MGSTPASDNGKKFPLRGCAYPAHLKYQVGNLATAWEVNEVACQLPRIKIPLGRRGMVAEIT